MVNFQKPIGNMFMDGYNFWFIQKKQYQITQATNIYWLDQSLPVKMNKFWPLSENKVYFQQIYIKWVKEYQKNESCTIFLGYTHEEDENMCIQI